MGRNYSRFEDKKLSLFCLTQMLLLTILSTALAELPAPEVLKPSLQEIQLLLGQIAVDLSTEPSALPTRFSKNPEWARSSREEIIPLTWRPKVRTVNEREMYDLDNPPRETFWWRYPIYAVSGFPRDLLDGFFGGASFVPPFNLLFTGLGYELLPIQKIVRHKKDRHGWRGHANANGHGWIDAEKGWGFFPHLHYTEFWRVDQRLQDLREEYNLEGEALIAKANAEIAEHNQKVDTLRAEYMEKTTRHYKAHNYRQSVQLLLGYIWADPGNREAKAMLFASLVGALPEISEKRWAHEKLAILMVTESKRTQTLMRAELVSVPETIPPTPERSLYLAWINYKLKDHTQSLEEVEKLKALQPKNPLFTELQFEVALASGHAPWITSATLELKNQLGANSLIARHASGRQAFFQKDYLVAAAIYRDLTNSAPLDPRFHYLLGMAYMLDGIEEGRFEKRAALREFLLANQQSRNPGEQSLYKKALRAAERLSAKGK